MIKENILEVKASIENLLGKSYEESDVTLIAVSKMHTCDEIKEAVEAGITIVGENKVQELLTKMDELGDIVDYHLIGHLQTNKVKDVVGRVKLIHSLDRESLLKEIDKRAGQKDIVQDVLIQLNISKEDTKGGIYPEDLEEFLEKVSKCGNIRVMGLMTMAPFSENPEEISWVFEKAKEIFDCLKTIDYNNINMHYLSMGMSGDYLTAISCGSNMVRVGTKIFGKRNY